MDFVECPYCHKDDIEVTNYLADLDNDNEFDCECPKCEKDFEVTVEFEPSFATSQIIYSTCEHCEDTTRDIKNEVNVFPFPKTLKGKQVCPECMRKEVLKELDERHKKGDI